MPIKIIKPGMEYIVKVQPFNYDVSGTECLTQSVEEPAWIQTEQSPAASAPSPRRQARPAEPAPPPPNLAEIEKTAYESGFRQGEKAGLEMAEKKLEVVMRRYAETVLELGKLKSSLYLQVEREVVKLAVEVAKKVVHREIQADSEIIQTLVKVALSHVAEKSAVTIHLHPVDYNYVLEHRSELSGSEGSGREIVLLADKAIERGGCLIQSECGEIDARIEEEFREVEQNFFEGVRNYE